MHPQTGTYEWLLKSQRRLWVGFKDLWWASTRKVKELCGFGRLPRPLHTSPTPTPISLRRFLFTGTSFLFFPQRQLSPLSSSFTYLHSAASFFSSFFLPMLPLPHVSHCPEVALLFLVPPPRPGSALCDSVVSCKQTILIGRCYS